VPSMWEAAGQRVSGQKQFHEKAPQNIRELYQRTHAAMRFIATRETERFKTSGGKLAWKWAAGPGRRISGTLITTVTPTYMSPMGIFPDGSQRPGQLFLAAGGSQIL